MNRIVPVSIAVFLLASGSIGAETIAIYAEQGRFTFKDVAEGLLRLDGRTGQVSLCSRRPAGWACEAVADDRITLETEIGRLQGENAKLRQELVAHGLPLPEGTRPDQHGGKTGDLKLPSDADLDRVMAFLDKVWRRLIDMVQNIQRDQNNGLRDKTIERKEMPRRDPERMKLNGDRRDSAGVPRGS